MSASVARLRSSLDIAKNSDSQLRTSADSGVQGEDDKESIVLEEQDSTDGDGVAMAGDKTNSKSSCSRKLLLQTRFGSFVVISDSSIVSDRFPGERICCDITPVKSVNI